MKLNYAGALSHITQRAAGADLLFHEDDDYLEFLGRMKDVAENYKLEILLPACQIMFIFKCVRAKIICRML
jgi:hypothetical protein